MSDAAPARPARLRLFVACDLPREVERAVAAWQREELGRHDDLRVMPALHLTLAFLGSVEAARVPDLERVLRGIAWRRAECRFSEPLFLPAHGKRRVVALELDDPAGTLRRLQADVAAGLAGRRPVRAREAPLAAARHRRQIPPSRSPIFPAKCEHRRVWCRPDGLV